MKEVYLISPKFIRDHTNVSCNLQDKFLQSAIREAQNINYTELIGEKLLNKLIDLVENGTLEDEGNEVFNNLLTNSKYYLAYIVVSRLCVISSVKLDNAGANVTGDEHIENLSISDVFKLEKHYLNIADTYAKKIQNYIKANYSSLSTYLSGTCYTVKPELKSSATTGLWLGGMRGKKIR